MAQRRPHRTRTSAPTASSRSRTRLAPRSTSTAPSARHDMRGGCAGQAGDGTDIFSPPGSGGGVVYLLAGNSITLQSGAIINASGAGGTSPGTGRGGSGGGSGGMIVLSAPTISANGSFILANGAGGAEGGGGSSGTGANGSEPTETMPLIPASGGTGNQGGDGGDGFARGFPATNGEQQQRGWRRRRRRRLHPLEQRAHGCIGLARAIVRIS